MPDIINQKQAYKYLRWILGDKERQKNHASYLETVFELSPTAEVFDGLACAQAIDKAVRFLDEKIGSA